MIARIGKSLEALHRRIRPHLSPTYRRAFNQMMARGLTEHRPGEPIVVCDFANTEVDAVGGRYYASMVRDFIDAGFFPVFTAHRTTLASFVVSRKKSLLLKERLGVVRSLDDLREPYFLITDRSQPSPALAQKVVNMVYPYRLRQQASEMELPFFVHPQVGARVKLPHPYRIEDPRWARIFFGGNTTEGRYSKDVIGERYHMLTRREMLAAAMESVDHAVHRPTDTLAWLDSTEVHPFVMFETQHVRIPQNRWIDALAKADFFLACPGVGMPLCHNLIEAMAGGAIPILQYANYLQVPLKNGVNALTFDSAESLRDVVKTALAMSPEQVISLRQGVHDYYHEFLAPGRFARHLFSGPNPRNLLFNAYRVPR
jgi:hypothetical protein